MFGLFDEPAAPAPFYDIALPPQPQPSFDNIIREIHAQNVHIQLLEQQKKNMT